MKCLKQKAKVNKGKVAVASTASAAVLAAFVGGWEGLRTEAYLDAVNVPTICYGETLNVKLGDRTTIADCDAMLISRLGQFEDELNKCLDYEETIPVNAKIAFISWAYNVGSGAACRSTLVRKANAGDLIGACQELPRWNKAGGRVLRGLVRRRAAEREMCLDAVQ